MGSAEKLLKSRSCLQDSMAALSSLAGFELDRVLSEDGRNKTVAVLGRFAGKPGVAVALLAKRHFSQDSLSGLFAHVTSLDCHFHNDVYSKVPADEGAINVDIIFPATDKHISKYSMQRYFMVQETPEQYFDITLPYIQSMPASRLQWVYNILDKKAETERILYENPDQEHGFLLLPDQKWDQTQMENLYLQAIGFRRDVPSIRALRAEHLPLLKNIRQECKQVVSDKYGVPGQELRLWCHYQPSYYHLHVHCAHVKWDGSGLQVGKAILLDDIIENVALESTYYLERTLTFSVGENDPLLAALQSTAAKG